MTSERGDRMNHFKIIRADEVESTYVVKRKNSHIDKKYHDNHLQISKIHMSPDRILYIDPVSTQDAFKTYYILEGSCYIFDEDTTVYAGDMLVFKNSDEVQTIKTLEETVLLVHASQYDVYKTLEDNQEVINAMLLEIQEKDHYTGEHSLRVYELVKKLGLRLGYSSRALNNLTRAAYYHDLGKIFIPNDILNKPAKLSPDEFEIIKGHVELARDMIIENFNETVYKIIYEHHERYNGSGYPNGLAGENICREARMLAICDSFDAMITDRVYKKGKSVEVALQELQELSGSQYDPELVKAFVAMFLEWDDFGKKNKA